MCASPFISLLSLVLLSVVLTYSSAVWLNLLVIFLTMGIVAHSAPNVDSAQLSYGPDVASGPVRTAAFVSQPLFTKINGIMNMVCCSDQPIRS